MKVCWMMEGRGFMHLSASGGERIMMFTFSVLLNRLTISLTSDKLHHPPFLTTHKFASKSPTSVLVYTSRQLE